MPKKRLSISGWREAMRSHFARAEFMLAGQIYDAAVEEDAATSYEDDLLQARILLKSDENKAVAFLVRRPPRSNTAKHRGEWEMLLGVGYARMRDFERADHHFGLARRLLKTSGERAQLAYHLARRWMLDGRLKEAWQFADEMSCDRSQNARIAAEMLRSFIYCHEERYRESAERVIDAIRLIGKRREQHLEEWFHAVQNLALLSRELAFDEGAALARSELDQPIEWPADFDVQQFQASKAVGWSCALRGDMLGCFRYLRAAERSVPSDPFAVILLLDRAYFARIVGEQNWALDEIAKAESVAERIDWNALQAEERIALLLLARAAAPIDAERARYYFARYNALDKIRSPLHLFAFDHRLEAHAAYSEGVVKVVANDSSAEDAFRRAWIIFDRIGYDWRAARVAMRLWEVTNKERWRHLAEDKLEAFPQSWLARELRASQKQPARPAIKLPRMQAKVFTMLCQKMTTSEIAQALGLSQHTVRNHLKAVFRAYGVNNRAALVAEAAARGTLPLLEHDPKAV
jgi:DNA-binding CsgD family transcriptional regulator